MAEMILHAKTNVRFEVIQEEKDFYVVVKKDEPEMKLRLEKFAVDGKMFKIEKKKHMSQNSKKKTASKKI